MIKVSVVVPIYNAQRFLRECMDSLVGQALEEIDGKASGHFSPEKSN